jgi:hypothetical protein
VTRKHEDIIVCQSTVLARVHQFRSGKTVPSGI